MILEHNSVAPGPRVAAISPPPLGGGSGAKRDASIPRIQFNPSENSGYRAPGLTRGLAANCQANPEAPGQARGAGCQ